MKERLMKLGLLLVVSALLMSGCVPAASEPTSIPGEQPAEPSTPVPSCCEPSSPPSDALGALVAVLAYLAEQVPGQAPTASTGWTEKHTKPEELVGSESYEYTLGDWVIEVSYPVVAPENVVYTVTVTNQATGFEWEGQVDAEGVVTEISSAGEEILSVVSPVEARGAALAYLAQIAGMQAPAPGLAWTETRTTPEGLVGSETYEYTAGDWKVVVSYPVTAPEAALFRVVVANQATGFQWEAEVDAMGEIVEFSPEEPQATPSPNPQTGDAAGALVQGGNAFAWDLYLALSGAGKGNLFFSPYSISSALAMTYAGARGETEKQMAEVLHFGLPQEQLHPAFGALAQELAQRGAEAEGSDGKGFRLNIANALWGQEGYEFLPEFLDLLSENYGTGLERVDFAQSEAARAVINDWVEGQTEGKIADLIPSGVLDALTRLVLANAIYFNAAWATPFEEKMTLDGPFTRLDGSQVTVPMMRATTSLGYAEGEGFQALELPYDRYEMSMVILLPAAGRFEGWEGSLDAGMVSSALSGLAPRQVALSMPRFKFDSTFSLKDTLARMGMPLAFGGDADFRGMTGNRDLHISEVLHKAFVSADEKGTEAAAATAVMMSLTSMPAEALEVKVDRPFVFFIRDIKTGTILFIGRVVDPSA
jgi:serpin B